VKIPSNTNIQFVCKDSARHRVTRSFGFCDFEGTAEESNYWSKASEMDRTMLKKRHNDTGECVLCLIDEQLPQKPAEPERKVEQIPEHQAEQLKEFETVMLPEPPKIVGGILGRNIEPVEVSTASVKVSWAWHKELQGNVAWTFQNTGAQQTTVILFRSSYYFGNAFWPIYENNAGFGTAFTTKLEPLQDKTIQNNSPPLALVSWKQDDGSYKSIIAFIFTLAPGQTWQMLEGGFSPLMPPESPSAYEVSEVSQGDFTIGYDPQQVDKWDEQTGTSLQGYFPNPKVFQTVQVIAPAEASFVQLFNDQIQSGVHEAPPPVEAPSEPPAEVPAQPQTQEAPPVESKLWGLLARNRGK
jgi:hypothetical protein